MFQSPQRNVKFNIELFIKTDPQIHLASTAQ